MLVYVLTEDRQDWQNPPPAVYASLTHLIEDRLQSREWARLDIHLDGANVDTYEQVDLWLLCCIKRNQHPPLALVLCSPGGDYATVNRVELQTVDGRELGSLHCLM